MGRNLVCAGVEMVSLDVELIHVGTGRAGPRRSTPRNYRFFLRVFASLARLANSFLEYMLPRQFFAPQ